MAVSKSQKQETECVVKRSRTEFVAGEIGDNIAIPTPLVGRGRRDPIIVQGFMVSGNMKN